MMYSRDRRYRKPNFWVVLTLFVGLGAVVTTSIQSHEKAGTAVAQAETMGR